MQITSLVGNEVKKLGKLGCGLNFEWSIENLKDAINILKI